MSWLATYIIFMINSCLATVICIDGPLNFHKEVTVWFAKYEYSVEKVKQHSLDAIRKELLAIKNMDLFNECIYGLSINGIVSHNDEQVSLIIFIRNVTNTIPETKIR